jgi:thiol:disulfide interchange protein
MKIARIALALTLGSATAATFSLSQSAAQSPAGKVHIYDTQADAKADIAAAIKQARAQHKRVILDFGGNWCGDCIVLDRNFHNPENQALLDKYFIVVHVDIGDHGEKNVDVATKYGVPLEKGVPALAVVDGHGKLIYSQKNGEFESMRRMDPSSVAQFLEQWKPGVKA